MPEPLRRRLPPDIEPFPGPQEQDAFSGTLHRCAWKGCCKTGEFRAPKDRSLREHYLFCLDHVRAYNAQWDFHQGLTARQMEAELRSASTWGRPTWKLGTLGGGRPAQGGKPGRAWTGDFRVDDPLDLGADTAFDPQRRRQEEAERRRRSKPTAAAEEARALKTLDLSMPLTLDALQRRYKELAKKHHPDANGGSVEAETRMKLINQAYQTLRTMLIASP